LPVYCISEEVLIMTSLKKAALLFIVLFIITGLVYPLTVMLISGVAFPSQAHGSLIVDSNNRVIGSTLIGQNFTGAQYFQSRPSASGYDPTSSGGSNLGPTNPALLELIANRTDALRKTGITDPIPSDLVTTSGSGLDPHISVESALIQVPAVAKARNLSEEEVRALVLSESINSPFTEPYVNVLSLNHALDEKIQTGREAYGNE
jgi:K+-transporting ATPase ATPase C chain